MDTDELPGGGPHAEIITAEFVLRFAPDAPIAFYRSRYAQNWKSRLVPPQITD